MAPAVRQVQCPACGKPAAFTAENRWRPFCSERCKMLDLGDWANERYRVPVQEDKNPPEAEEDPGEQP
jgi:endogenous inhibitor of DNA gyrase (YacG/DUF329 family)